MRLMYRVGYLAIPAFAEGELLQPAWRAGRATEETLVAIRKAGAGRGGAVNAGLLIADFAPFIVLLRFLTAR
jgi:hypothetical protein